MSYLIGEVIKDALLPSGLSPIVRWVGSCLADQSVRVKTMGICSSAVADRARYIAIALISFGRHHARRLNRKVAWSDRYLLTSIDTQILLKENSPSISQHLAFILSTSS